MTPAFYSTKNLLAGEPDRNKRFLYDAASHELLATMFPRVCGWSDFDALILQYFETSRDRTELNRRLNAASDDKRCCFYIHNDELNTDDMR